ncbi:SRPBCC domain-containing protein [Candidatus Pacearchaeota archaeon]|nr:SRPBCC domain-containing protein [Candidatus Pacearchaeota archaeon]
MKTIKQTLIFDTNPHNLYEYIINPRKQTKLTNAKATNTMKEGGKFSAYDDYITGTNLKLIPDKKIIQNWTCSDFPPGVFTEVTFELKLKGNQTELIFTQTGIPDDYYEDLVQGWEEFYWKPIREMLEIEKADALWK